MIAPATALRHVLRHTRPLSAVRVPIAEAPGHVLAEDVRARYALPRFDNTAMDGFALASSSTRTATRQRPARLRIDGAVYAGDTRRRSLPRGSACPIMTGAPLPRGADTVIPVEKARVEDGALVVAAAVPPGRHVRGAGEEVRAGARMARRGALVHPGTLACLATAGRATVRVVRTPRVSVISTGDETVAPGRPLAHGQIYDSNLPMLVALAEAVGMRDVRPVSVGDRRAVIDRAVDAALRHSDVVVISGGVSVGERDYVRFALEARGVRQVFWRVRQKPGKPLYFGVRGRTLVFGLPGNPASAFTCFCLYVVPALRRLSGLRRCALTSEMLALEAPVARDVVRWSFMRARTAPHTGGGVVVMPNQGSHMITALADADRLVVVPPGAGTLAAGTRVLAYRLPYESTGG